MHKNVTAAHSYTIGALSAHCGVNIETIRYYERIGIMPEPPRKSGGHRVYASDHLKRLCFIRRSRELGFTLQEIRALLGLVDSGTLTCGEVQDLALKHLGSIREKIADLQRLESMLTEISNECTGGQVPDCPIVDALWSDALPR